MVFIPTGSLEPRSSPRGDFGPHSTHIIIWQCSLVDCNSKRLHTPCDIAQITTMMMTKIDRDERYTWDRFTESSMRSKIRFQGFPVSRNFPQNCNQLYMKSKASWASHDTFVIACNLVRLSGWRPGSRRHLHILLDFSQPMAFLRVSRGLHLGFW